MERSELLSPHDRAQITRVLKAAQIWNGERAGVKIRISLERQPDLENHRIKFWVRMPEAQETAVAGTVFEAADRINSWWRRLKVLRYARE